MIHKLLTKIRAWRFNRQVKELGVVIGKSERYKTIVEALNANKKIIIIPKGKEKR